MTDLISDLWKIIRRIAPSRAGRENTSSPEAATSNVNTNKVSTLQAPSKSTVKSPKKKPHIKTIHLPKGDKKYKENHPDLTNYQFLRKCVLRGDMAIFTYGKKNKEESLDVDPFTGVEIVNNFTTEEIDNGFNRLLSGLQIVSTALTRNYKWWREHPNDRY